MELNGRNFLSKNKPHLSEAVLVTKHSPFHLQSSVQTLNNNFFFFSRAVKYVLMFHMKDGKPRREAQ